MRIRNKSINDAKPVIFYATKPTLAFDFDVDLPTGTYTLAIDVDRTQDTVKMAVSTATPVGRRLTFALDTYNTRFRDACAAGEASIEIWRGDEVYLQDTIPVAPRVDVDGIPPAPLELYPKTAKVSQMITEAEAAFLAKSSAFTGTITVHRESSSLLTVKSTAPTGRSGIDYVGTGRLFWAGVGNGTDAIEALRNCWGVYDQTAAAPRMTINAAGLLWAADISISGTASLAAKLAQIDAALAAGGEGSSWSDQLAGYREYHAVYGEVIRLDNLISVKCYGRAYKIAKLRLAVVSADPAVTGNAVLIPVIAGVDGAPVVAAIGATASEVIFDFNPTASGLITIRRDTANVLDTLKSGNVVSVLVLAVQKMVAK